MVCKWALSTTRHRPLARWYRGGAGQPAGGRPGVRRRVSSSCPVPLTDQDSPVLRVAPALLVRGGKGTSFCGAETGHLLPPGPLPPATWNYLESSPPFGLTLSLSANIYQVSLFSAKCLGPLHSPGCPPPCCSPLDVLLVLEKPPPTEGNCAHNESPLARLTLAPSPLLSPLYSVRFSCSALDRICFSSNPAAL